MKRVDMEYVYILKCGDGSLYTGWTNDIEKKICGALRREGCKIHAWARSADTRAFRDI